MTRWLRNVIGLVLLLVLAVAGCARPVPLEPASLGATPVSTATPLPAAAPPAQQPAGAATDRELLWPFADEAAAMAWQRSFRAGGAQPWHVDSAATALGFVRGFLGFTGIDQVTSRENAGAQAWVGVGSRAPDGSAETAAVLHLVRFGTAEDAPWEVVGTRDTALAITAPAYGATVHWPLTVTGTITGVDESLHVRVLGDSGVAADLCCTAAGGQQSPWTVAVPKQGSPPGVLTVVVSTGGHTSDVERFAITAVRS